jgi:PTH2 family peptidyl-tRNA hydrolase
MPYKQAIVVRKDLKLGEGKTAAQVAHASIGAMKKASKKIVEDWEGEGAKKVVLKVSGLKEFSELQKKVTDAKLPNFVVRDAGLTQVRRGTITCIGIGPAEEEGIDKITKELKLL